MKRLVVLILSLSLCRGAFAQGTLAVPTASNRTTAWRDGGFHVDVAGVIGRSDIVLGRANMDAGEALPLGNGRLGVAVWAAEGLTAQLNRADTLPERLALEPACEWHSNYRPSRPCVLGIDLQRRRNQLEHRAPLTQRAIRPPPLPPTSPATSLIIFPAWSRF